MLLLYEIRELMEGSRTNLRAGDIFALGATIYELALGATLPNGGEDWQRIRDGDLVMFRYEYTLTEFRSPSNSETWRSCENGRDFYFLRFRSQYSNSLQHLIASMMHPDPLQRPLAEDILQHEVVLPFRS